MQTFKVHFCLGILLLSKSTTHEMSSLVISQCYTSLEPNISKFHSFIINHLFKEESDTYNSHFDVMNIGIATLLLLIFNVVVYKCQYSLRRSVVLSMSHINKSLSFYSMMLLCIFVDS